MKNKVLVIDDDHAMRLGVSHFLRSSGYDVHACQDGGEGISAVADERFDLVITDLKLPHFDGLSILKKVKETSPATGVIIMTAFADVKTAVQAIKDGAFDYIAKPFTNEELLLVIDRFTKFRDMEDELNRLRESVREKAGFEEMIGSSPSMRDVFARISAIADTDVPVLILGESGTGKELVANALHNLSPRRKRPFIKINCAAIPEQLFESELFGHERGAFTGATEMRIGKFEAANGGSIFFDEIAEMPLGLQAKLLRVIEDQTITRLGGHEPVKVDVRGIYATGKNMKELIVAGKFREDLFYRITVVPIEVAPLRKRREDIPLLIGCFLKLFGEKYGKSGLSVSAPAYEALMTYDYPGNVRELKHSLERAVLLSRNGAIDKGDLPQEFRALPATALSTPCSEIMAGNMSLQEGVNSLEKHMILSALKETSGRRIEAAGRLGISRKILWKKIKEYGIETFPEGNTE